MAKTKHQQAEAPLAALECTLQMLNERGVRYCQWKSNIRLDESLRGRTDLDLLVDPQHIPLFQQIMKEQQVKLFQPAPGKEYPSITNYLGYDPQSGLLYHLHVHEALVLGEQFVKNYYLPVEADFLESTSVQQGVKTPRPEVELIIFVVRALLKYRDRDGLKEIARSLLRRKTRSAGFPQTVLREANWLLGRTTLQDVQTQLRLWEGMVPGAVVLEFLEALQNGSLSGVQTLRLRGRLRQALQSRQRSSRGEVMLRYFREDWRRKRKIFKRRGDKKMTLPQGGLRFAIIGADGAGKSTVLKAIESWLSWRISVRTFYMGKSKTYLQTRIVKAATSLSRRGSSGLSRLFGKNSIFARIARGNQRMWENLSLVAEAWERTNAYHASLRERDAGCIVIYDRYPLPNITVFNRPLDAKRIMAELGGSANWLERKFAAMEESMYQEISLPENFIALQVSPAVSQARKPDHGYAVIAEKARALDDAIAVLPGVTVIQADAPIEQVIQQVKSTVWERL